MSRLLVQIGNARLEVPLVGDEATTRKLAAQLTGRLQRIEAESSRIDTQAFALRAAFELASELHLMRTERDTEQHDLTLMLDRIVSSLQDLRTDFEGLV